MPATRTLRSEWIDEGLRALAAGGPDAVRVEPLAKGLGVSKGGFYWHFDNRGVFLDALLDSWEQQSLDDVIERVESSGGDGRARLWQLFSLASTAGDLLRIDLAIRDWARRDEAVAKRLRRVDNRRMDYLRLLFGDFCSSDDEVEARALLVGSLWIGSHFMAADHGARSRAEVLELAVRRVLT